MPLIEPKRKAVYSQKNLTDRKCKQDPLSLEYEKANSQPTSPLKSFFLMGYLIFLNILFLDY